MLGEIPFLIPLVAGAIAGGSAVLLRRAAIVMGEGLGVLSVAASVASAGAYLGAFYWAAISPPTTGPSFVLSMLSGSYSSTVTPQTASPTVIQGIVGLLLALGGGALIGWSLRLRGIGVLQTWVPDRFEQRQPYRSIRRPLELGVTLSAFALCWLRPIWPVWICFAVWLVLWNGVLELGDWELRHRLPACRDYLRRTPRYVPRVWRRRPPDSA